MRLGIVVTDAVYLSIASGIIKAARERAWQADCFLTDTGVMLLADEDFVRLACDVPGSVALCEHSVARYAQGAYDLGALADQVVVGGQYQDAELVRRCDRVLVF
ncbi:MAG: hypothetical protein PHR30_11995 [Gallionellaceae bacterium]|nr:hypothetical protein [Gallionellaceae bacterium]MDD5366054.1 hypothetical protein [Gallionellaceae bacterium]